jgi:hypothetical protein
MGTRFCYECKEARWQETDGTGKQMLRVSPTTLEVLTGGHPRALVKERASVNPSQESLTAGDSQWYGWI